MVELPSATVMLLSMSDRFVKYWYAFAGIAALFLAADLLLVGILHSKRRTRNHARVVSGIVSVLLILLLGGAAATLLLTLRSVTEAVT